MAFDALRESHPQRCDKEYLGILYLAARQSETAVDEALRTLLANDQPITQAAVEALVQRAEAVPAVTEVTVEEVDLSSFDDLFLHKEVWDGCEGGCDGEVDGILAGARTYRRCGSVLRSMPSGHCKSRPVTSSICWSWSSASARHV